MDKQMLLNTIWLTFLSVSIVYAADNTDPDLELSSVRVGGHEDLIRIVNQSYYNLKNIPFTAPPIGPENLQLASKPDDDTKPYLEVELSSGRVRGQELISVVNQNYYSFQGIPYASPPVGPYRFKAPRPPKKWNGVLQAVEIPKACAQPQMKYTKEKTSEDCLYINVYTPHLKPSTLLPVMVWIHGGKHFRGSSTRHKYGADFLITRNITLVTFNYRLGVFGYLNLNTKSAQGNAALKDMVAALRWVQKEIRHFGGDPDRVTIFGGSSGGQDVNCLYLSPLAKGLFHRAISQSAQHCGTTFNFYNDSYDPSLAMAKAMGCYNYDREGAVACLRNKSTLELEEKQMEVHIPRPGELENPFLATLEKDHGEEIFLPSDIEELMKISKSNVPYIMGINSGEALMNLQDPKEHPTQFSDFEKNFELYLPVDVRKACGRKALDYIIKKLKRFYFDDQPVSEKNVQEYVNFMMDRTITYNVVKTAETLGVNAPVYFYFFAFEGAFEQYSDLPSRTAFQLTGVNHGGEQGYLFYRGDYVPAQNHLDNCSSDFAVLNRTVELWTNFAKYGNPTPEKDEDLVEVSWLPVKGSTKHLLITNTLTMIKKPLFPERMSLWSDIYSLVENEKQMSPYVALVILLSVSILSVMSAIFLLYDCLCSKREYTKF